MSQENVEIARAAFEAWNAGELQDVLSHFHPELVYHPRADEPDPSPHVGRDGTSGSFTDSLIRSPKSRSRFWS
jgi:ketosteroid isomerase-like protein